MGNNTKIIKGTNIPVMIKVFIGKGKLLILSPIKQVNNVIAGYMAIQTITANFHLGVCFIIIRR